MRRHPIGRLRLASLSTVALLGLAACGSNTGGTGTEPAPPAGESTATGGAATGGASGELKVGLAYDVGGRGDLSFNDAAATGLDRAVTELGVEKRELSPNTAGTNRGDNLRALAEQEFDPVIAVGFAYAEDLKDIAADFPDTTFFIVDDASVKADNVKSLVFAEEQGSFLVGAAAALKSTKGSVGFIGGVQTPLLQKFEAGFVAGAKAAKPAVRTQVKYLSQPPDFSGFNDPAKGRETANGMFDSGSDVLYAAAGGSGTGVFQSALANKGKAVGVDSDQYQSADAQLKPVILTSMLKRVDVAVFESLQKVADGAEIPAVTTFDLKSDGVGYATSGGFVDDIQPRLDAFATQIESGAITVPTKP